jgi:hypothetical protein
MKQYMTEETEHKILKLNLQLVVNDIETTVLEGYLKNELDTLISKSHDTLAWKDAKEQLGTRLVTRDLELANYKSKYHYSAALNIGLIVGIITYRFMSYRS